MLKKLLENVGEYKKDSILTPIYVILEVIMEVIIPLLMAKIVDVGLAKGDINYVVRVGVIMLLSSFFALFFGIMSGKTAAKASTGFSKNLRRAMYHKIQTYSFANIDKFSTSGLVTRLTTDVTNIQNAFQMCIRVLVRAPIMLISALIMSFYLNSELAVIFMGAIIFLSAILYFIMTRAHGYFQRTFKKYDDLNASVQENLTGIRVVKAYVREEYEKDKFHKASSALYSGFLSAEKLLLLNTPAMQFTMYTCNLLLSWLGAHLILKGRMGTGELMSMFTYTGNILISLMIVSMVFVMVVMSRASMERIYEVLKEESDLRNNLSPVYEVPNGSIEFKNVDFSYSKDGDRLVLENVNLRINAGETVGIIGGTGSAKSSLVQLIPRLYDTTRGSVEVGGINVRNYDMDTLRNEVSMVLQKNVLFSGTIKENLRWGNKNATEEEIRKACEQAQAKEFIEGFEKQYDTYIEQGGTNVSGGQKQRLCIARALLKKPKILIFDDSTSAVDTKTDAKIRKALKEGIPGTTKIIIAQRISSIENADKIIVIHDGKINGMGTHEELLESNSIYREVYLSQTKGAAQEDE